MNTPVLGKNAAQSTANSNPLEAYCPGQRSSAAVVSLGPSFRRSREWDNSVAQVLNLINEAGFLAAKKVARRTMLFRGIAYYRAAV